MIEHYCANCDAVTEGQIGTVHHFGIETEIFNCEGCGANTHVDCEGPE